MAGVSQAKHKPNLSLELNHLKTAKPFSFPNRVAELRPSPLEQLPVLSPNKMNQKASTQTGLSCSTRNQKRIRIVTFLQSQLRSLLFGSGAKGNADGNLPLLDHIQYPAFEDIELGRIPKTFRRDRKALGLDLVVLPMTRFAQGKKIVGAARSPLTSLPKVMHL